MSNTFKRALAVIVVGVNIIAAVNLYAEEPEVVRWSDVESLLDSHPMISISRREVDVARAEVGVSRLYPNPEVTLSYGRGAAIEGRDEATIWGVEVEIPIDAPGAYLNESYAAEAELGAAENEQTLSRLEVIRRTKSLFYTISIGQQKVKVLQDSVGRLSEMVEVAKRKVELGEARKMELSRLEIEYEKASADLEELKSSLETDCQRLSLLLGNKIATGFRAEADWETLPTLPDYDELQQRIMQGHPALSAASSRVTAAQSRVRAEKHRAFPEMRLGGFYDRELDAENYGVSLSMAIPLWNFNISSIDRANMELAAMQDRKTLSERELEADLFEIYARAGQNMLKAGRYKEVILPKARKTADDMDKIYRVGEISVTDLIESKRNLIEVEMESLSAVLDGWLAYFELATLIGDKNE